jgi:hypothetical protein
MRSERRNEELVGACDVLERRVGSRTSVTFEISYHSTQRCNSEDSKLLNHCHEELKSYLVL